MCNTVTPADVQVIMHVCVCMCTLVFWNVDFFSPKAELRKMFAQGTLFNLMWQLRGKGSLGRMDTWYVWLRPSAVHLKLSQHGQSAILQYELSILEL